MEPMRLLVTDAAAQPPRQATAWLIMTLGRNEMKPRIEKADWDRVHDLACEIVNATSINDGILSESKHLSLFSVLDELESKYGRHPSIIATRGDFTDDPNEALALFHQALELARFHDDKTEEEEILDSIENLNIK